MAAVSSQPDPSAFLPLTPAVFHILLALADGEKHGYAIMQEVKDATDGSVHMGPGTLYGSLDRMVQREMIDEVAGNPSGETDERRRRYYRLSEFGRKLLSAETARLWQAVRHARAKQVLAPI